MEAFETIEVGKLSDFLSFFLSFMHNCLLFYLLFPLTSQIIKGTHRKYFIQVHPAFLPVISKVTYDKHQDSWKGQQKTGGRHQYRPVVS